MRRGGRNLVVLILVAAGWWLRKPAPFQTGYAGLILYRRCGGPGQWLAGGELVDRNGSRGGRRSEP